MREFRARHTDYAAANLKVAGVTTDTLESCKRWAQRLRLPYPLLSDSAREAGVQCHVLRRVGFGGWNIEFFHRTTMLVDSSAVVRAVWGDVKLRGHAREVLAAARALSAKVPPS
ncbi:MAG: redoxin domain-containing protein [Candidatus Eisenbacteria bacterium]